MLKIDAFCHVMPRPYYERFMKVEGTSQVENLRRRVSGIPALVDMDLRLRQLEEFGEEYRQIINITAPPLEYLGPPKVAKEMARVGNESLAELVAAHPDRFVGFMAAVPMDDVDTAIAEAQYARDSLGALGVQIYTDLRGEALDHPRFDPFYAAMADMGALVQVHPCRSAEWPDYPTEQRSRFEIWWTFGWEYDLSAFMARIVFAGVLDRHPNLKLLIHHGGSMVPHFAGRVGPGWDQLGARTPPEQHADIEGYPLTKRPIDYFKMMYGDTALFGAAHAVRCCIDFYGIDHICFGSDSPYDPEKGPGYIRSTIKNLQEIGLSEAEQEAIFHGNITRLTGLTVTS